MKEFLNWVMSPHADDYTSNPGYIYKRIFTFLAGIAIIVVSFLWIYLKCNLLSGVLTFLLVASASAAMGAAIGFLFGLPRSEKYRFINKESVDHTSSNNSYGDNTNLEEVSDWLTKIIVGLTLIKLNTILGWIDNAAHAIEAAFTSGNCNEAPLNAYVFGYCTILLYFLASAGLCYLWARTNLSLIFTKSKVAQAELEKQQLMSQVQTLANPDLDPTKGVAQGIKSTSDTFRNLVESVYSAKSIIDKSDLQKGRWGGAFKVGNYIFEATYIGTFMPGIYKTQLSVRSLNTNSPLAGQVAFFLHDTFPSEIVYAEANNNKAEITISAFEAFVAGAKLEDGTELELELNKVKGFPEGFYWKN